MAKKNINNMDIPELSRWGALLKALDIIEENCEAMGKPFEELDLKPIAIKHYINDLSDNIQKELEREIKVAEKRTQVNTYDAKLINRVFTSYQKHDALQDNNV